MKIAKIVSSNSHIDYVGRVIDSLDVAAPPPRKISVSRNLFRCRWKTRKKSSASIYNSMLINPDYANYGPRLSPKPELGGFSPDYLNEQGFLIGILLLGSIDADGKILHGVPRRVVPAGQDVYKIEPNRGQTFSLGRKRLFADSLLFANRRARRTFRRCLCSNPLSNN